MLAIVLEIGDPIAVPKIWEVCFQGDVELSGNTAFNEKHRKLTEAIGRLIEDYSLVRFIPLNLKDHENVADVLLTIDNVIQFGEDQDIKTRDFEEPEDDKED